MPALVAGMQLVDAEPQRLVAGAEVQKELIGSGSHEYSIEVDGGALITVENLGRGTILTVNNLDGSVITRSANWRGREHVYTAALDLTGPVTLTVEPDQAVAPPGSYRIVAERISADEPHFEAERTMTRAADLFLKYYFEEPNSLEDALAEYMHAAGLFSSLGMDARRADALFDAGNVQDILGQRSAALGTFSAAESYWSGSDDPGSRRGVASAQNLKALVHWSIGEYDRALSLFESVAATRSGLGDEFETAQAYNNLGLIYRELGDPRLAMNYFREALDYWQGSLDLMTVDPEVPGWADVDDPPFLQDSVIAMQNLGWAMESLGDYEATRQIYVQALRLSEFLKRDRTTAELRNNLGRIHYSVGQLQEAMELFGQSLQYFSSDAGDPVWAALVHHNIALIHRATGDEIRAVASLNRALSLISIESAPIEYADVLRELSEISLSQGDTQAANQYAEDALSILGPDTGNIRSAALLQDLAARANAANDDLDDALPHHNRAVRMFRAVDDKRGETLARTHRAMTNAAAGRNIAAVQELRTALEIAEQLDLKFSRFQILVELGVVYLGTDETELAQSHATRAIDLSEQIRTQLQNPALLRDFSAIQRRANDVLTSAALRLGQIEVAWSVSDGARGRRFRDLISESDIDLDLLSESQQQRFHELRDAISVRAEARTEFLARNELENAEYVLRVLTPMIDELSSLQRLARGNETTQSIDSNLSALQRHLDEADVFLEFHFGEFTSGAWSVRRNAVTFVEYEDPQGISSAVRSLASSLRSVQTSDPQVYELSRALFGARDLLPDDAVNLVIVPDGELTYLPFAALFDPATDYRDTLLTNRSVVYLPSGQALQELLSENIAAVGSIAVLADPVFESSDPRVTEIFAASRDPAGGDSTGFLDLSLRRSGNGGFARLPGTMIEANAIAEAAGEIEVVTLTGTAANRDYVLEGNLREFGILHFATHGVMDLDEPALSGLVLSGFTDDGRHRNRFLRSQEIAGLNLSADLVVLSGCDTGIGREVRGEGLNGLSRAFFYAGASTVISSLWQVPDVATAELMSIFYDELLNNKLPPQEALRTAQLRIRSDPRWRAPYFWAAFIIQGDWNSRSLSTPAPAAR